MQHMQHLGRYPLLLGHPSFDYIKAPLTPNTCNTGCLAASRFICPARSPSPYSSSTLKRSGEGVCSAMECRP